MRIHRDDNPSIRAIAFSPQDDCLYGISATHDGGSGRIVTALRKFNLRGAELNRFRITKPIIPSHRHHYGDQMQMFVVGKNVVVIPEQTGPGKDRNYVIDSRTGRTTFVCLRRPR